MTAQEPGREAGRVVPVYAVTGGRTRSTGRDMPVEALVTVTAAGGRPTELQLEYRTIVELAVAPISIVEIGATLGVPVGVARVLVGDLADAGYLDIHLPPSAGSDGGPSVEVLERLLEGLRAR
ncbi:DUF742 domain-containing protein [Pseudonocardia asaccharolytica]|uniref:DUF742 domain-containing protein n=1 Tax=Pseudonocardia asaccharolytica DSM 44247 = NBRC 16224 TaxID=1123024 RepID=A0A511D4J2_9PSEU|nr:DUF742 domain-containing protein [Pseudonocardia asaccharolytica]GEL19712.1 hypothetical protein PA7_35490 [Pseudonocardia asaccharolytica DSM 44247 = NBRC 16224]